VQARIPGGRLEVEAKVVVVAAGGMGTPIILQRSGLFDAGQGFISDPLVMTYGVNKGPGSNRDIPMSCGTMDFIDDGILMTDMMDPWATFTLNMWSRGIRYLSKVFRINRMLGIMTKAADELNGRINLDGTFSKPLSYEDRRKLDKGASIAENILVNAGCNPDSVFSTSVRCAHPGGTARIGEHIDNDLQTEVKNLYVCDTSLIPQSFGLPPVWTLVAFGKRLVVERLKEIV